MSAPNTTAPPAAKGGSATWRLIRAEMKLNVREKVGPFWGVGFPLVLMIILGSIPSLREPSEENGGLAAFEIYVPVIILFTLALLALIALPGTLAGYREHGVLRRMQTTPIGSIRVLAAQLAANLAIAIVAAVLFYSVAVIAFGVHLPGSIAAFAVGWALVAVAMLSIGLLITALAPGRHSASAIGTVLFFPMMFFAGLWIPITQMPPLLRDISHYTPLGAAMRVFQDAYEGSFPHVQPVLALLGYAIICSAAAIRWFRWQ
ncbi:ABC transporter permease [Phytomonospora sp. NPDC050363]|uniref:ABC transporter permease n=1 Tax=Phytomonospora sp. NPDC050363 TaxID=3155642 RepID=UPI0033F4D30A